MTRQDPEIQEAHLIEHPIKSELVHQGSFLQVRLDTVRLPHGGQATREYVVHPGAVVVIGILAPLRWFQSVEWVGDVSYWVTSTSQGLIWAYLSRFCAVAMQTLQSGYARVPASMDEAARTLGVSSSRLFRTVHVPLLRNSVVVAGLLVLVDVMKELPATLVLRPFDSDTLAVVAYQLARDERLGEAALPSLTLVAIGLIPVIWVSRSLKAAQAD